MSTKLTTKSRRSPTVEYSPDPRRKLRRKLRRFLVSATCFSGPLEGALLRLKGISTKLTTKFRRSSTAEYPPDLRRHHCRKLRRFLVAATCFSGSLERALLRLRGISTKLTTEFRWTKLTPKLTTKSRTRFRRCSTAEYPRDPRRHHCRKLRRFLVSTTCFSGSLERASLRLRGISTKLTTKSRRSPTVEYSPDPRRKLRRKLRRFLVSATCFSGPLEGALLRLKGISTKLTMKHRTKFQRFPTIEYPPYVRRKLGRLSGFCHILYGPVEGALPPLRGLSTKLTTKFRRFPTSLTFTASRPGRRDRPGY